MNLKNFKPHLSDDIERELTLLYKITELKFPDSVEAFYRETNGGRFSTYILKNKNEAWLAYPLFEYYVELFEFFSIEEILENRNFLINEASIYLDVNDERFFLNTVIPIFTVNSYNYIGVCCKGKDFGKLFMFNFDSISNGELPIQQQLVTDSFESLLEKMIPEEEDEEYQELLKS